MKSGHLHLLRTRTPRHRLVGRVRGRFDQVLGTITVSPDPAACSVDVTIDVASISTQVPQRDDDLRGEAYFDVKSLRHDLSRARHSPCLGRYLEDGRFADHAWRYQIVPLTFKYNGVFADESRTSRRGCFHGTAATKRAAFGMGARDNAAEVADSTAPDVDIAIDVEADANPTTP